MERLKLLMFQQHISQAKIAKIIGVSEKTLSKKMQGETDFWWNEVVSICKILGIKNPMQYFAEKDWAQ